MKWRWLFILALPVLAGLLSACNNAGQSGLTAVTITIGSGKASSKPALPAAVLSKATATVATITYSITGSGMDPVSRTIAITPPQTVTEVFYLTSGPARKFQIEAKDGSNNIVYSGSTTMDLNGTPVTLTLPLQTMIFNRLIWSPWRDEARSVARASNGDIVIVGHTFGDMEGSVNVDPTYATADIFVARVTATGLHVWTRQFGTIYSDNGNSVAVNEVTGDIYIGGSARGDLNGESAVGLGQSNAFVTKLSSTGAHLWTRLSGTAGATTFGKAIAIDASGNAYLTGNTSISTGAPYDVFVTKWSPTGLQIWGVQVGTPEDDTGEGVVVNAAGTEVTITGSTKGNFATQNLGTGTSDIHVHTFDALTGGFIRKWQDGTPEDDDAWAVAMDVQNNIYIAGETSGSLSASNQGLSDFFVASYGPTGVLRWKNQIGTPGIDSATSITVDPFAGVVVTGTTGGDLQGAGSDGFDDSVTVLLDVNGNHLWTRQYGTRSYDDGIGVVTDGIGNISVVGNTFGGFTSSATEDIFLLSYDSLGNRVP